MPLLNLPPELAIHILFHLSLRDLAAWRLTHSSLRALIDNSILVQYHIATLVAGVEDNTDLELSVDDRLEKLRTLEDGWARLDFDFSKSVEVEHNDEPLGIYDLKDGVFLLGNGNTRELHYFTLPTKVEDETKWRKIDVGESVVDMGLGIYEHDLIAVITTTPQAYVTSNMHNLEIVLLKFSTGEPHPEARQPRIFVAESQWMRPAIGIEIVGDTLALVTTCYESTSLNDNFYLFDWKTGALKMHATAPNNSYACLLFLSPTLLLLPNGSSNVLEFWDATSTSPFPIGALGLPPLNDGWSIISIECRCDPNPVAKGTPLSRQPFRTAPTDAIAIFNMRIFPDGRALGTNLSMFVHRGTLLGLCPSARDADGESEFEVVPWETWGPDVARWLKANANSGSARYITTTAGARAAVMVENSAAVVIMDFHPARIHRAHEGERDDMHTQVEAWETGIVNAAFRRAREGEQDDMYMWMEDGEMEIVSPAFAGRLVSRLPYVARMLPRAERYNGLSMDEERLIGLWTDAFGTSFMEIEIHHLGARPTGGTAGGEDGDLDARASVEALSINETA